MRQTKQPQSLQQQQLDKPSSFNHKLQNTTDIENDTSANDMRYSKLSGKFNDDEDEEYDRRADIVPVYETETEE